MELTWEMAGQYLFFAGLFASILGIGKVLVIMSAVLSHLKKTTGKSPEYGKERKRGVSLSIIEGLAEMTVGTFVIALVVLIWNPVGESQSVILGFGVVFAVLTVILYFITRSFLKDLEH